MSSLNWRNSHKAKRRGMKVQVIVRIKAITYVVSYIKSLNLTLPTASLSFARQSVIPNLPNDQI